MPITLIGSAAITFVYAHHQPIDKLALTRSLAWPWHARIGSSEFIDTAGPARLPAGA